jgi:hypothetical protein
MIAPAEKVVRGITLNVCLLKYCRCNENGTVEGGYCTKPVSQPRDSTGFEEHAATRQQ